MIIIEERNEGSTLFNQTEKSSAKIANPMKTSPKKPNPTVTSPQMTDSVMTKPSERSIRCRPKPEYLKDYAPK